MRLGPMGCNNTKSLVQSGMLVDRCGKILG
jgi:hypothetical protein